MNDNVNLTPVVESSSRVVLSPQKQDICAIIVTYFPDAEFVQREERIRKQVGRVLIVDNTPDAKLGVPTKMLKSSGIEIIQNNENLGVGAALNLGMARANELGFRWAITFDQDSWVHDELVTKLIEIYVRQPRPELVGIIGCNFEDENTRKSPFKYDEDGPVFLETRTVITSGSLISAAVFYAAGSFRSDFFIDFIDHEYCLRLRKLGYRVLVSTAPLMVHALGAATPFDLGRGPARLSLVLTNRSPLRRYYMTRNGLLVARLYIVEAPIWVIRNVASILGFALLKIAFEKNRRLKKFWGTLYGAFDGLRSKTGKATASWLQE